MRNGYIQIYFWGTSSPENSYLGYEFSGELVPFRLGYEFSRVRVLLIPANQQVLANIVFQKFN